MLPQVCLSLPPERCTRITNVKSWTWHGKQRVPPVVCSGTRHWHPSCIDESWLPGRENLWLHCICKRHPPRSDTIIECACGYDYNRFNELLSVAAMNLLFRSVYLIKFHLQQGRHVSVPCTLPGQVLSKFLHQFLLRHLPNHFIIDPSVIMNSW